MADFSGAQSQRDNTTLIPQGTLAKGVLTIRPVNPELGVIAKQGKPNAKTGVASIYLDTEVTICEGEFTGKKLWQLLGVAGNETFVQMGHAAIKAILEGGRGAGPQNPNGYVMRDVPDTHHPGQVTSDWMELNTLPVFVKIGVEPGKDGYPAKNKVALWMSPVDPVTGKDFARLMAGDTKPDANTVQPAAAGPKGATAAQPNAPAWMQPGAAATAPAPAQLPLPAPALPAPVPAQAPVQVATPAVAPAQPVAALAPVAVQPVAAPAPVVQQAVQAPAAPVTAVPAGQLAPAAPLPHEAPTWLNPAQQGQ